MIKINVERIPTRLGYGKKYDCEKKLVPHLRKTAIRILGKKMAAFTTIKVIKVSRVLKEV